MPLYEIAHCVPLTREQKDAFAQFITHLHATTFVTPTQFVNVVFNQPPSTADIYAGGKFRGNIVPNHIRGTIRTGPTRTKEKYDDLAMKLQSKWNEIVDDTSLGAISLPNLSEKDQKRFKKLHGIVFTPMVSALEKGVPVSNPGEEGIWLKENMAYFKEQADVHEDEDIRDMLKELGEREDLKKLME